MQQAQTTENEKEWTAEATLPPPLVRKNPLYSAFLSIVLPGMGNVYNGLYLRGVVFFLIICALGVLAAPHEGFVFAIIHDNPCVKCLLDPTPRVKVLVESACDGRFPPPRSDDLAFQQTEVLQHRADIPPFLGKRAIQNGNGVLPFVDLIVLPDEFRHQLNTHSTHRDSTCV